MQVVPNLLQSATYPITAMLDIFWDKYAPFIKKGKMVDPCTIETVSMLERALNYGHTRNAAVLPRSIMD